jgi:hypothetical protein
MKKMNYFRQATITATLLLCAVFCQAQIKLTNPIGIINTDTTTVYDTIKVVMLVSDTSSFKNDNSCFWVNGYEVRIKKCCINGNTGEYSIYQPIPYYEHVKYLFNREIGFRKLVVWQAVSK